MRALPIDPLLPELTRTLKRASALVLQAPPGAGKTTRVPWALLKAGLAEEGEILVAEPRRLAARLAARHVAHEHRQKPGATVGYSVRFEDVSSERTRIRYLTEGVLVRRLLDEPTLGGVAVVVLDEFHERHLATDLCLAWVRHLQKTRRPDLKLVVMSATLEAAEVASFLDDCPCLRSEGRQYPVSIEHVKRPDERPLFKQVASAVKQLLREGSPGDILVFLPGAAEIQRARDALTSLGEAQQLAIMPLHGDLPLEQQARAVAPAKQQKIVLSTNVAESSVTIDGVTAVVDSGVARAATHSPWSGLARLATIKISRAAAAQRAGRAGRTRPGRVLRLYTRGDHDTRPEHDPPEILRSDLSETLLVLRSVGHSGQDSLAWLTPPPATALTAAETLLERLGALDTPGKVTKLGRRMLRFPLHPRLARIVVEGEQRGVTQQACLAAALLQERDIRAFARTRFQPSRDRASESSGPSDVLELVERFEEAADARFDAAQLRLMELDVRAVRAAENARKQLRRLARNAAVEPSTLEEVEAAVGKCILAGFPDRVARRRKPGERDLILSSGETARLSESSVVHTPPLMVAVDVEERAATGRSSATIVRLASAIESEWLLDLHPELLDSTDELVWNGAAERVERLSRIACGSVVLEESRTRATPSEEASRLLARAARAAGAAGFSGKTDLEQLVARIALLREHQPEAEWPDLDEDALDAALETACQGLTSFEQLRARGIADQLYSQLSPKQQRLLREHTPERLTLPGGRSINVHYEREKTPWIASRLQDFFGMSNTPRIAGGSVPVTVHLLAPNQRAVQLTTDLAGFWERHYPKIRRELMRRYPKHAWPEDGATATPPQPRGARRRKRR